MNIEVHECAEEIYAHTVMYYFAMKLKKIHIYWRWLILHANPIDMQDNGDALHRKIIYKIIWILIPSKRR